MKKRNLLLYSILLIILAHSFIGIGFAVAIGEYHQLLKAILFSMAFFFWSIFVGSGFAWLLVSILCGYMLLKLKKVVLPLVLQTLASFFLGFSVGAGWGLVIW